MKHHSVKNCNDIDLDKHALIEASAGTGKTYTIENLVVRMLIEKDVTLENILLVTFTEKATGELKKRIRENINSELHKVSSDKEKKKKLEESLVSFDSASIYTIHGFCQSILMDFSFEIGQPFDLEVVSDDPLYEKLLYEQMRSLWKRQYGSDLADILEISGFPNKKLGESEWINTVLSVAKSYKDLCGNFLLPKIPADLSINQIKEEFSEQLHKILDIIGFLDKENLENSEFYQAYGQLNFRKNSRTVRQENIIIPLLEFLHDSLDEQNAVLKHFYIFLETISKEDIYKKEGIACLVPKSWNKKGGSNLNEKCPYLVQLVSMIENMTKSIIPLRHILPITTIKQLGYDVAQYKKKNGLISFDDMLAHVAQAIDGDKNKDLLKRLRTEYKYALVDEFQDTDAIQWKIFREIFLNGKGQCLFLIGDPKQAIYSFRGADVYTYLDARRELKILANKGQAILYSLETNYRSCAGLIHAFNYLFKQDEWFGEEGGEFENEKITYSMTSFPPDKKNIHINERGRAPFTVVNIIGECDDPIRKKIEERPVLARKKMAEFTSREINNLVNNGYFDDKNKEMTLDYGDICILVRKGSEVSTIEKELDKLNIPHTYYKKPGLYQSDEALELAYLFRAIEKPNNDSAFKKALLTSFFSVRIENLHNYDDVSPSHPTKRVLQRWNEYVMERKWSCLFQSIIEDSGILVRELEKSNADRKLTNYKHILQNLEEEAAQRNLDFADIINTLESFRLQTIEIERETDLHKIESEKSKVKIMTIHSSKGLEFPVLFLIGGFGRPGNDKFFKYHEKGTTFYDLAKSNDSKEKHKIERQDEDRRLYYVALTRAKYRVYIPEYKSKKGSPGPVADFIYQSIQAMKNEWQDEKLKESFTIIDIERDKNEMDEVNIPVSEKEDIKIPVPPFPPGRFDFHQRMIKMESYSSLNYRSGVNMKDNYSVSPAVNYPGVEREKGDDELGQRLEHIEIENSATIPQLPRGIHVGNMFHEILENIDFSLVKNTMNARKLYDSLLNDSETLKLVEERLTFNRIEKGHRDAVTKIIWDTLTTPIEEIASDFIFANLTDEYRIHELEFCYPFPSSEILQLPEEIKYRNGFLTGFIDMVFNYKDRYFIVDWKSNYIEEGYSRAGIERIMDESNYHLQYRIYTEALVRWLKQCMGDKFDHERTFGGVLYIFLRGIGLKNGNGIYYISPEQSNIYARRKFSMAIS